MIRILAVCAMLLVSLVALRPASAYSLISLAPHERQAMLTTCNQLPGRDRSLCRSVVNDRNVIANDKRSCLQAMTLLLQGSTWAMVRSLPATVTCRRGLQRAGYPVTKILRRHLEEAESAAR